ncbi:unnamed protein product [Acanthoscelides obtectus]|uniref:Uncharacterized protein n=1 Tax=Acanthoscelides obtectus TaxID=200917 RepID=A0A9P0JPI8_ACAOB|nr:unnamed protein product [Acanthoscelides obtectus]CAK1639984.1 hypothetical protein AOBTE_LOCUS11483 [Acanthoscelides obtectus]
MVTEGLAFEIVDYMDIIRLTAFCNTLFLLHTFYKRSRYFTVKFLLLPYTCSRSLFLSMLNCVNALEQHLPATEQAGLVSAEEKPPQQPPQDS